MPEWAYNAAVPIRQESAATAIQCGGGSMAHRNAVGSSGAQSGHAVVAADVEEFNLALFILKTSGLSKKAIERFQDDKNRAIRTVQGLLRIALLLSFIFLSCQELVLANNEQFVKQTGPSPSKHPPDR